MTMLLNIAPTTVAQHPSNPRSNVGDVSELADSIRSVGILEPLIIAPAADGDEPYILIAGHRRLAAAKTAGLDTVPALLRGDLDTVARQLEAMLVENLHRVDLTPIEEGDAYQALLEFPGYTAEKVAKATGRSPGLVRDRLKLAKLPEGARDRVHTGQVTIADAQVLAEFAGDQEALERLDAVIGTYNWTWVVADVRRAKARKTAHAKLRKQFKADGVTVLVDYPDEACIGIEEAYWDRDCSDEAMPALVTEHAACPGHAAILRPQFEEPEYVCTQPALHPEQAAQGETAENAAARAQAEADRAAAEQLAADLQTAAVVRRAHLGMVVRGGDLEFATELRRASLLRHFEGHNADRFAGFAAQIILEHPERIAAGKAQDVVRTHVAKLDLPALVILEDVLGHVWDDDALLQARRWESHGTYDTTPKWLQRLGEDYGYEWSDVELALLSAAKDGAE